MALASLQVVIFDWAGTLMRDLGLPGPMADWPEVAAMPGAAAALDALSGRAEVFVASGVRGFNGDQVLRALGRAGLANGLVAAYTGRDLSAAKTEAAYWHRLLERIGYAPEACVMVGDTYDADIAPAKLAGLYTVWFAEGDRGGRAPLADATIHHLDELVPALEAMGLPAAAVPRSPAP